MHALPTCSPLESHAARSLFIFSDMCFSTGTSFWEKFPMAASHRCWVKGLYSTGSTPWKQSKREVRLNCCCSVSSSRHSSCWCRTRHDMIWEEQNRFELEKSWGSWGVQSVPWIPKKSAVRGAERTKFLNLLHVLSEYYLQTFSNWWQDFLCWRKVN